MKTHLDEMGKNIQLHAQSLGYKLAVLLLAIWTLYESYIALVAGQRLYIVPSLVLTGVCTVEGIYKLVLKQKMVQGDDEYREPNKVLITILAVIAITAIIVSIGSFVILYSN